jgi:hypothetical protein
MSKFIRILTSLFLAACLASPSHATISADQGQFIYRYKDGTVIVDEAAPTEAQRKDITAFYVGAVGFPFSERLPMKPQWVDDAWVVSSGTLPEGITFDPATLTFSGTPTSATASTKVELQGYENGARVAVAEATFDVYSVPANAGKVDIYAHTGFYKFDQLKLPAGVTVYSWDRVYMPPSGIDIHGPYLEGFPVAHISLPLCYQIDEHLSSLASSSPGSRPLTV